MTNKKYLILLLMGFFIFFGWNIEVEAYTSCDYLVYYTNGGVGDTAPLLKEFLKIDKINGKVKYNIGTNLKYETRILKYNGTDYEEYTLGNCPNYLVFSVNSKNENEFYAFDSNPITYKVDDIEMPGRKNMIITNVYQYTGQTNNQDQNPNVDNQSKYYCKYDLYKWDANNQKYFVTTTNLSNTIYYTDNIQNNVQIFQNVKIFLSGIEKSYNQNGTSYYDAKNGGTTKISNLRTKYCPHYLVPSSDGSVDMYDSNTDEQKVVQKAAKDRLNVYYKKSKSQEDIDAANAKGNYASCAYYRSENSIGIEIIRGFNDMNMMFYDVNVTYYGKEEQSEENNQSGGKKYVGIIQNFSTQLIDDIVSDGNCSKYPYVSIKKGNQIDLTFIEKVDDVRKSFLYYKLAISQRVADDYMKQIINAHNLINNLVEALKDPFTNVGSQNERIKRIFESAAMEDTAPDDIQNVVTYLSAGGKTSKAIYDYTSYWYAQAANYEGFYVEGEGFNSRLSSAARGLIDTIEENIKAGYIPIPDGCAMLSQDLIDFLAWGLRIIRYGAVIIAIVLGMVDFFRAIAESDDKAFQKAGGRFLKRLDFLIGYFYSVYSL